MRLFSILSHLSQTAPKFFFIVAGLLQAQNLFALLELSFILQVFVEQLEDS